MMGYTTPHARRLYRMLSKRAFLFTEMIPSKTLIHAIKRDVLIQNNNQNPIAIQVGGSDFKDLIECSKIAQSNNFDEINLNDSGVKVFDFHPSHVYMNTRSLDEYENIKQNYHDMDYLNSVKNSEKPGNRNIFFKILDFIEQNNIEHKTMVEINNLFRSNSI